MRDTLRPALLSIINQIDENYEIVVVDDGSDDGSQDVLRELVLQYPNFKFYSLKRDSYRKLGYTRNISIEKAQGDYVLLHLDCDDITLPAIQDFVAIFHHLEQGVQKDFLLSGRPIQMAKRDFLLKIGPYQNIHRGEDRDMLMRLAQQEAYYALLHGQIKKPIPKSRSEIFYRNVFYTYDHLRNDFRKGLSYRSFIEFEKKFASRFSFSYQALRYLISPIAYLRAKLQKPLDGVDEITGFNERLEYLKNYSGTYTELIKKLGLSEDDICLSEFGQSIFC